MIHHVFANRSNVGDWLSARGIQALLAPHQITEHLCDEPFIEQTLADLSQLTSTDFIVIGGGGLFMDYFAPFWEGFRPIAERVPFAIWGVGLCDMKRETSRVGAELLKTIVRQSQLCAVRDELTRNYLDGCETIVVPCPAINCVQPRPPGPAVMHVDAYDNVGPETYELMERTTAEFAAESGRPFISINNLIPAGSEEALAQCLRQYEQAGLIVAGRLHACIIGLAMGRNVLAVSGDWKVESFMRATNLDEWVLDLDQTGHLPERLRQLEMQPSPTAFLDSARCRNSDLAERVVTLLSRKAADSGTEVD